jgi:CheY-like chemotaxis protein
MNSPLRILHLEDNPQDAELIQAMLEAEGIACQITRLDSEPDFSAALEHARFDLILTDYTLPSFDGLSALKIALEKCPDVPFLFVSGTPGEEVAIETLKIGATDYILKHRLSRLVPAVQRALRESHERAERRRERTHAEEERRLHLWFLESMDRVNRAIQGTNEIEQMMSNVLETVLSVFDCDRAWLVHPCNPDAASWRAAMEHTRVEFPGVFALGADLPVDAEVAAVFAAARASTDPVTFGPGCELDLPGQWAERFTIRSQIAMALYPKLDQPYLFGLHQCSHVRLWTAQEQRLFREIGRRLADALATLSLFRSLRDSERKLEEAQRIARVGWWE